MRMWECLLLFGACFASMVIFNVKAWIGGFGDRCPNANIDEIDDIGSVSKNCFDIIDKYGDCLLDDMILPESMCRSIFGDDGYEKMLREQVAINLRFALIARKANSKRKYLKKIKNSKKKLYRTKGKTYSKTSSI